VISQLRSKCNDLEERLRLQDANEKLVSAIKNLLSSKQIQRLVDPETRVNWSDSDIAKAISLDSVSTKGFQYMRETLKYPLPSRSTIQRWLASIVVKPGILHSVLNLLQTTFEVSSHMDRTATLAIDEMAIDERLCYDAGEDRICGGSDQMLGKYLQIELTNSQKLSPVR